MFLILKSDSHLPKNMVFSFIESALKHYLFHLEISYLKFLSLFLSSRENALIRKIRPASKLMASQPG